jgi:predicted amidophosphoribosyltransferase
MGVLVRAAFDHAGVARDLVHRLKYWGSAAVADVLAVSVAPLLPDGARALIPVPRVFARRWRYGVDPAIELASAVARRTGLRVVRALRPTLWAPRRAGPAAASRGVPRFTVVAPVPAGSVLVDDVVTTGTTLAAAADATGVRLAVTATSALRP